jgi:hypothetical protein
MHGPTCIFWAYLTPSSPQLDVAACPEFNDWHYGFDGALPPYVGAPGRSLEAAVANYGGSDVWMLAGAEDTCNADLVPGCNEGNI